MKIIATAIALIALAGCATDPAERAANRRAEMFDDCMDDTMPKFGPVTVATAEQRRRAAETCGNIINGK